MLTSRLLKLRNLIKWIVCSGQNLIIMHAFGQDCQCGDREITYSCLAAMEWDVYGTECRNKKRCHPEGRDSKGLLGELSWLLMRVLMRSVVILKELRTCDSLLRATMGLVLTLWQSSARCVTPISTRGYRQWQDEHLLIREGCTGVESAFKTGRMLEALPNSEHMVRKWGFQECLGNPTMFPFIVEDSGKCCHAPGIIATAIDGQPNLKLALSSLRMVVPVLSGSL
eukprot:1158154-Pelagomonas_calceolata.AAC.5